MNDSEDKIFHDSFARCTQEDGFFKRFYDIFVNSSDEVKAKFENTDMEKQVKMLTSSFYSTKLATSESTVIQENLKKLATIHSNKERDIRPELYDLWLDALIQTVREFDSKFSYAVETVWREKMTPGIEFMKSHYDV
jgi:hemoglobin-like flavoprotein